MTAAVAPPRPATARPGPLVAPLGPLVAGTLASAAWGDHGGGVPASAAWSPLTAALVLGALALLAGILVVLIVAALTRRREADPE